MAGGIRRRSRRPTETTIGPANSNRGDRGADHVGGSRSIASGRSVMRRILRSALLMTAILMAGGPARAQYGYGYGYPGGYGGCGWGGWGSTPRAGIAPRAGCLQHGSGCLQRRHRRGRIDQHQHRDEMEQPRLPGHPGDGPAARRPRRGHGPDDQGPRRDRGSAAQQSQLGGHQRRRCPECPAGGPPQSGECRSIPQVDQDPAPERGHS